MQKQQVNPDAAKKAAKLYVPGLSLGALTNKEMSRCQSCNRNIPLGSPMLKLITDDQRKIEGVVCLACYSSTPVSYRSVGNVRQPTISVDTHHFNWFSSINTRCGTCAALFLHGESVTETLRKPGGYELRHVNCPPQLEKPERINDVSTVTEHTPSGVACDVDPTTQTTKKKRR